MSQLNSHSLDILGNRRHVEGLIANYFIAHISVGLRGPTGGGVFI